MSFQLHTESFLNIPIKYSTKVSLFLNKQSSFTDVLVKGDYGIIQLRIPFEVSFSEFTQEFNLAEFFILKENSAALPFVNLYKAKLINLVLGVASGYRCTFILRGMGFKAKVAKHYLQLKLGWSHLVNFQVIRGIYCHVCKPKTQKIVLYSISKELLSQAVINLMKIKWPNIYTGKGITRKGIKHPKKPGKQQKK